jgi:hypothetical protein
MKIKIFKNKKSFKKGGLHTNPDIFWDILQGLSLLLIISSFVFGFYLFTQTNQESILPVTNTDEQVPTVNINNIKEVLKYFSLREEKSNQILNSPSGVIDPSL